MKSFIFLLTFCIAIPAVMTAQSPTKAQKQMDKYNYTEAIEILKQDTADKALRSQALPLLAECYRLQRDIANAKSTYALLAALPDASAESFFYYAQALQMTGDYEKARLMYLKYSDRKPYTIRADIFAAHCDSVLGPWKGKFSGLEVKNVETINTAGSDFGPSFYKGDLTFASDFINVPGVGKQYGWTGRGYLNIMKAHSIKVGDFWGSMAPPTEFDSVFDHEFHDGPATFNSKGTCIYFTRSFFGKARLEGRYKTNLLKIFYCYKIDGTWTEEKPFFLNSTEYSVGHPALSADGQTLYFASDMPGGIGGTDIWMCKRDGEAFGKPVNLGSTVNTNENEMFPDLGNDGVLYFASEGHPGYGGLDIFKTSVVNGGWTTPENLHPPVNGSYDDFAITFIPGSKGGFFSSNRPEGSGSDDIYTFRVPLPPPVVIPPPVVVIPPVVVPPPVVIPEPVFVPSLVSGLIKDKNTLLPLAGATVFLYNPATEKVNVLKTDSVGIFRTKIETPSDYVLKAMIPNYIADCIPFPVKELKTGNNMVVTRDMVLDKLTINKTFRIDNIYYDFSRAEIREDAKPELDKLVRIMKENAIIVELGSHTDSRGSFGYNDTLSQNRADSAVYYIISSGIEKNRITAKGYGEHQLTNKCSDGVNCSFNQHQANRRTEFKVTGFTDATDGSTRFNPEKYKEGEQLDSKTFPPGFFYRCK